MIYVRKSKVEDANKMLKMLLELDKETKFMMLEPGERSTNVKGIEWSGKTSVWEKWICSRRH